MQHLTMTKNDKEFSHSIINFVHTCILFIGMGLIMSFLGFILVGVDGILWAVFLVILILVISPNLSSAIIFSLYRGRLLRATDAPGLYQIIGELSARADLVKEPQLYYIPSQIMNAFSVGTPNNPAIGLTDALLKSLSTRELIGVLAHEVSHIQHNDLRLMGYADILSRITNAFSLTGLLLVLVNLPLFLLGMVTISWFALAILIITPNIMGILQSSLSRMREFDADRQAALLTGDPEGLAMALGKFEFYESSAYDMLFRSGHSAPVPSILRTHPVTEERIRQLLSLKEPSKQARINLNEDRIEFPVSYQKSIRKPRWHIGGIWY
jgi:heat shock protein HtpX